MSVSSAVSPRVRAVLRSRLIVLLTVTASVIALVQGLTFARASHVARALASAASGTGGQFVPLDVRILDTRPAYGTGGYTTPMPAHTWRKVAVEGVGGIPSSGVAAVAVNFTVSGPTGGGIIFADKDETTPNATVSYVNYPAGGIQTNSGVLAVGSDGKIQVMATSITDLFVDVQGYYTSGDPAAGGYVPITPARLVDTRNGTGLPHAQLAAGSTSTVQATGHIGIPAGASGLMVNFTILNQSGPGYLIPYPADVSPRPTVSLNYYTLTDTTAAEVGLSTTGTPAGAFKLYNAASSTDVTVDVVGYFTATTTTGSFTPATTRVLDTRTAGHTTLAGTATATVQIAGVAGVPAAGSGISAITANIAVLDGAGSTSNYLRGWANGTSEPPTVNTMHYQAGQITTNMATVALGADGAIKIHNLGTDSINLVIDVEGWYSNVGLAIANGQDHTQQSVTLQADPNGGGSWVSYQYRVGTTAGFSNVPVANVKDGNGTHPTAWPVQKNSGTFTAYTWNIRDTLAGLAGNNGVAPDSLLQVQACYGTSSTDTNLACGAPSNIQFAQSAFGDGFATEDVGPGTLSTLTGDYSVDATDAEAATSLGGLSIGRTLTTLAPEDAGVAADSQRTDASGVFGPGWTADLSGPDAGEASLAVTDKASAGYLIFTDTDGGVSTYQATTSTATYPITFTGVGDATGDGETVSKVDATHITMTDQDGTTTTWIKSGSTWRVDSVDQPGSNATSTYTYNGAGLVMRILAPVPDGITCANPDTTPGCRSLMLDYEPVTIGGVTVQRLQDVQLSIPQVANTANKITVADYDYTGTGLLADAYDRRITPNLKTAYTYNSGGRLATLTPPGQAAYSFGYDGTGRLSTVTRPDPSGQTATATIVYDVPTTGTGAPVDLSASETGKWDEVNDLPVTGTAIFPPDHNPAGTTASTVTTGDWPYAPIDYLDVNGQQVNTAQYGAGDWQIDTTQYDSNGNDVWDLSAGNHAQAKTPTSDTDPYVAGLSSNVDRAAALASTTVYNPLDPSQVTDTYGPTHPVTLHDGTVIDAQAHVATTYDEGAPNNDDHVVTNTDGTTTDLGPYGLPTTVTTSAYNVATNADTAFPDAQITHNGYDPIDGGSSTGATSGWTLGAATIATIQMDISPSAADLVTKTRYDSNGRIIEQRLPGDANGTTPRTTLTTYYTASGSGDCASATAAGLVCSTAPAAQPSTGKSLAITTYDYNQYGDTTTKTETYGTGSDQVVRTTTTTYDAAERGTTSSITVSPTAAGGTPLPTVTYSYDPSTGLPTTTSTGTGPDIQTLTTGYNNIGEATAYSDATGNVSHTNYNLDGQITSVDDGKGTTSYTYDSDTEHRGLITGEDIGLTSAPSTFSAAYDAAGNLATETYPNGLTATRHFDNVGSLASLTYAKSGSTWMRFTEAVNPFGQIATQSSPQSSQTFAYDADGRLITVQDTYDSACATRAYSFDADSNRTSLKELSCSKRWLMFNQHHRHHDISELRPGRP